MPSYYLHRDGQNFGPYPTEQMMQMIAAGQVGGDELICEEGGSDWIAASSLSAKPAPGPVKPKAALSFQRPVSVTVGVTQEEVSAAYRKLKVPFLGLLFSAWLPFMFWAAKSDSERGVRTTGKHRALQELLRQNTEYLPVAIVIGSVGVILCAIWLIMSWKAARQLKAQLPQQQKK